MTHRFFGYLALFLALSVSSCSWLEKRWPHYHELEAEPFDLVGDPVPTGTKRLTLHWACADDGGGGWFCAGREREKLVTTAPRAELEGVNPDVMAAVDSFISQTDTVPTELNNIPPKTTAQSSLAAADSYLLQLAAYNSQFTAQRRLQELAIPGFEVVQVRGVISDIYAILSPMYVDKAAAELVGGELQTKHAGLSYWVRHSSAIKRVVALEQGQQVAVNSPVPVALPSGVKVYPLPTGNHQLSGEQSVAEESVAANIDIAEQSNQLSEAEVASKSGELDQLAAWAVEAEPVPATQSSSGRSPPLAPSAELAAGEGFVLQLAAYRLLPGAEQRLRDLAISGSEIIQVPGEIGDFYAIVQGRYADKQSARLAGEQLRSGGGKVDYWIRPLRDVVPHPGANKMPAPLVLADRANNEPEREYDSNDQSDYLSIPATRYVLQLASYRSLAGAKLRMQVLHVPGAEIVKTRSYYVIVAGGYPIKEQARAAGEALKTDDSSLDYWIRDSRELKLAGANISP